VEDRAVRTQNDCCSTRPAYDIVGLLDALPFVDEMVGYMNDLGWDVHSFDHEGLEFAGSKFDFLLHGRHVDG